MMLKSATVVHRVEFGLRRADILCRCAGGQ